MYVCTELDPSLVVSHSRKESTGSTGDVTFVSAVLYVLYGDELGAFLFPAKKKKREFNKFPALFSPTKPDCFQDGGVIKGVFFLPPTRCLFICVSSCKPREMLRMDTYNGGGRRPPNEGDRMEG